MADDLRFPHGHPAAQPWRPRCPCRRTYCRRQAELNQPYDGPTPDDDPIYLED